MQPGQPHHLGAQNLKLWQGGGQADRLGQPMFGKAPAAFATFLAQGRMKNIGARGRNGGVMRPFLPSFQKGEIVLVIFGVVGNQSSPS